MGCFEGQHNVELMGYVMGTEVHYWEWFDALLVVLGSESCWSCSMVKGARTCFSR